MITISRATLAMMLTFQWSTIETSKIESILDPKWKFNVPIYYNPSIGLPTLANKSANQAYNQVKKRPLTASIVFVWHNSRKSQKRNEGGTPFTSRRHSYRSILCQIRAIDIFYNSMIEEMEKKGLHARILNRSVWSRTDTPSKKTCGSKRPRRVRPPFFPEKKELGVFQVNWWCG